MGTVRQTGGVRQTLARARRERSNEGQTAVVQPAVSLSSDVGASAGRRERSDAEDRRAGETADADQQGAGPRPGEWEHAYVWSPWRPTLCAGPGTLRLLFTCAGGACQHQHSGAHLAADRSGEGPNHPASESSGATGSGGPAGRRTRGPSAPERRGRWGSWGLDLPLPSTLS